MVSAKSSEKTDKLLHSDKYVRQTGRRYDADMAQQVTSGSESRTAAHGAPLRSDVQRNRTALLQAARELFATNDDVPMYEVAKRAGVGQATLYRHFPDRAALASAIAAELIEELERGAAEFGPDDDCFFVLFERLIQLAAGSGSLVTVAREDRLRAEVSLIKERLAKLFVQPLRVAKRTGTVRDDLEIDDIPLLLNMLQGALDDNTNPAKDHSQTAERVLAIVRGGIERSASSRG